MGTNRVSAATRANRSASGRAPPLPFSLTATARRRRSIPAIETWSSISTRRMAFSTSAEAAWPLTFSENPIFDGMSVLRRWNPDDRRFLEDVLGLQRAVRVADAPEALGVAQVL